MAWLLEWLDTLGVGAFLLAALAWAVSRRKTKSEVKKTDTETADKLIDIAMGLVEPVSQQLQRVSADLEAHKLADAKGKAAREENSRAHMHWDQTVAEKLRENGIHVDDPPPLYEGGHT